MATNTTNSVSNNSTPTNTPDVNDVNDGTKMLDIFHNGTKIGVVPDTVPDEFDTDDECRVFVKELKELPKLSDKHSKTLDNCLTILAQDNNREVSFGPSDILVLSELAFRYPEYALRIMSLLQYLMSCLDFVGTVPEGFYGDVGEAYGYLGSIMGKISDDNGEDKLDDIDQFGFDLGDSFSESADDEYDDDDHSDDEDFKHSV